MRKTTLILAFLAVALCGRTQSGSSFLCDTSGISIFNALVNGKHIPASLIYCSEDKHHLSYELSQPFMENDTQYIWRSYQLYKCDLLHPSVLVKGLYVLSRLSANGALDHTLVTPQENLSYFDLINAYMCDLQYLDYDTVNYEAHTDPALMTDIRDLQKSLKEQASNEKQKTENKENSAKPIVVEGIELFPADGNALAKSFSDTISGEAPFMFAEEMPVFPGGADSLNSFLRRNTQWPHPLYDATGTVLIEFIVETDGSIANPTIKVSLTPELDAEALRLIKLMPRWKPALNQGKPVRCYYILPMKFLDGCASTN